MILCDHSAHFGLFKKLYLGPPSRPYLPKTIQSGPNTFDTSLTDKIKMKGSKKNLTIICMTKH